MNMKYMIEILMNTPEGNEAVRFHLYAQYEHEVRGLLRMVKKAGNRRAVVFKDETGLLTWKVDTKFHPGSPRSPRNH